jgi:protein-S-isoprenylcysteine O-methyltransferase Ste14
MASPNPRPVPESRPSGLHEPVPGSDSTPSGDWFFRRRSFIPLIPIGYLLFSTAQHPLPTGGLLWHPFWITLSLGLGALGLAIRAAVIGFAPSGTSGRATKFMRADTLSTSGMYSVVRHPLYLGNALLWLGVAAFVGRPISILLTVTFFGICYRHIMRAEEAFLCARFPQRFSVWAQSRPAIIPTARSRWVWPRRRFSIMSVLGRDYSALYGFVLTTFCVQGARTWSGGEGWQMTTAWYVYIVVGTVIYGVLHVLKRSTTLFDAPAAEPR